MKQIIRPAEELFVGSREFILLADAMPQIVWLADSNGTTFYYNAKWYDFIGSEEEHDKEPYFYSHVLHPDDSRAAFLCWKECIRDRKIFNIEYRFIDKKNGGYRWFLARALPVLSENGDTTWYGTYTDIHDQKLNQQKLAEALSFRDEFLSIASHELKTPLTSLKLQIQLGIKGLKSGKAQTIDAQERILNLCLQQSNRLSTLVDDLLDITQIQEGKLRFDLQPINISTIIKSITLEMSHHMEAIGSKIELNLPEVLMAQVDIKRVEQVFLNLYINAVKYAPGSNIKINASEAADHCQITFQDFGPGIELSKQNRIFERYERAVDTRHISGLGLGLYIVKRIVEGHKGDIKLRSEPGIGTSFEIILPKNQ